MRNMGENIRKLRDSHHWTQLELSNISGVSVNYISAIERGERSAGKKTIHNLCEAFAVTEEVLRFGNQRAKFSRQELELLAALREDREKFAVAMELAAVPSEKIAFVREAVRLMQRYPER